MDKDSIYQNGNFKILKMSVQISLASCLAADFFPI
jgi:hypothetical protein